MASPHPILPSDPAAPQKTLETRHDLPSPTPELQAAVTHSVLPQHPAAPLTRLGTLLTRDPSALDAPAPTGEIAIPGYELLGELGRGGMGVVYQARQIKANRLVALKMILARAHAGVEQRLRFQIEAEAVARLQHPNIVQLHEVGEHAGLPFFSLEFCAGGSLAQRLKLGRPSFREAAALAATLARAVHYAHLRGVVHRDLKPANVMLAACGSAEGASIKSPAANTVPKITDFGLAKRIDTDGELSRTGTVMGTPSYMAPEQAAGKVRDTGPATDVWSLGAILYELLTGRPPFLGETAHQTMQQVLTEDPVTPSRHNPRVPRDLETIALKCLRKDPASRYADATSLADDLIRFLAGEPVAARPVSTLESGAKWVKRNRGLSAGIAAAVLALLLGTAVSSWQAVVACSAAASETRQRQTAEDEKKRADAARKTAEDEKKSADAARKAAEDEKKRAEMEMDLSERLVYAGKLSLAQRAFQEGIGSVALQYLNECQWNLRGWEHRHLWKRFNSKQTLLGHDNVVTAVAFSVDGKRIVSGSWDRTLKVWDADTGQETLTLKGHRSEVSSVAFSGDGKRLVSGSNDKTAKVWDAVRGQEVLTL